MGCRWGYFKHWLKTSITDWHHYNSEIRNYNNRISELKSSTRQNIPQLESELKKLNIIKASGQMVQLHLCARLFLGKFKVCQLSILRRRQSKAELDSYSVTVFQGIFSSYQSVFTNICSLFGNIETSVVAMLGRVLPQCELCATCPQHWSEQDDSTYPSFKYTLSEGDKMRLTFPFSSKTGIRWEHSKQDRCLWWSSFKFDLNKASTISIGQHRFTS